MGSYKPSGWGLVTKKTSHIIRGLKLYASQAPRRRRKLDWISSCDKWFNNSRLFNETPINILDIETQWSFAMGEPTEVQGLWCTWLLWERAWKLSGTLLDLPFLLWLFLIWLFLSCLLYNKTIIISIALSWVMWVICVNYWNRGGPGKSWIYNWSAEMWEASKTWGWVPQWGKTHGDRVLTPGEADTEGSARISQQHYTWGRNHTSGKENKKYFP